MCRISKPAVFALGLPANNLIRFSDDFGGETNLYQGFDVNLEARFRNGAFLKGGIARDRQDVRQLQPARRRSRRRRRARPLRAPKIYPDGTTGMPSRIPLPAGREALGLVHPAVRHPLRRHVSVQPRRADRRRRSEHPGELWPVLSAVANPQIGRNWTGAASRTIQLIREGSEYGDHNLSQLDLRASKRFDVGRYRLRVDFDVYNVFNSSWPFTVSSTYSTAGHVRVAATDQRAAEPLLQARRAALVLTLSTPKAQLPIPNYFQLPTSRSGVRSSWELRSWKWLGVGMGFGS